MVIAQHVAEYPVVALLQPDRGKAGCAGQPVGFAGLAQVKFVLAMLDGAVQRLIFV